MRKRRDSEWFLEDLKEKKDQIDDFDYSELKDPTSFDEKRFIYKQEIRKFRQRFPPNFNDCRLHKEAQKIKQHHDLELISICQCCGQRYDGTPFNLMCNPDDLKVYGFGLSLFFTLLLYFGIIFICIVNLGLFSLCFYYFGSISPFFPTKNKNIIRLGGPKFDTSNFYTKYSVGNLDIDNFHLILCICNLVYLIIFYFVWLFFYHQLMKKIQDLECNLLRPSDYTILITNLQIKRKPFYSGSLVDTSKEDLAYILAIPNEPIHRVLLVSDMEGNLTKKEAEVKIQDKVYYLKYIKIPYFKKKFPDINEDHIIEIDSSHKQDFSKWAGKKLGLTNFESELTKIRKSASSTIEELFSENINQCFLTFNTIHEKKQFKKLFQVKMKKSPGFEKIVLEKAPEPEDLIIANLHITSLQIRLRRIIIYGVTIIFLAITTTFTGLLTRYKNSIDYATEQTLYTVISIIASLFTLIVNKSLVFAIPLITKYERNHTFTDYETSVAFKVALTLFFNSAIVPLFSYSKDQFFINSGLIETIWINWLLLAVLPPIIELINPLYIFNLFRVCILEHCSDAEKSGLSQIKANLLFEGVSISLVDKYAETISLLFFTAFYVSVIPIASVITIIGLFLFYFVNKYLLLNRYIKPNPIGYKISTFSMACIGAACSILFAASNCFQIIFLSDSYNFEKIICSIAPIILLLIGGALYLIFALKMNVYNKKGKEKNCIKELLYPSSRQINIKNKYTPYDHKIFDLYDYQGIYPLTQISSDRNYANNIKYYWEVKSDGNEEINRKQKSYKSQVNNIIAYKEILLSRPYGAYYISNKVRSITESLQKNQNDMIVEGFSNEEIKRSEVKSRDMAEKMNAEMTERLNKMVNDTLSGSEESSTERSPFKKNLKEIKK